MNREQDKYADAKVDGTFRSPHITVLFEEVSYKRGL